MANFIIQHHYKKLKELEAIKAFIIAEKESFISEELHKTKLEQIEKEIKETKEKIKNLI